MIMDDAFIYRNKKLSPYSVLQTIATDVAIWHPFWKLTTATVTLSYR